MMKRAAVLWTLFFGIISVSPRPVLASKVVVVLSDEQPATREALRGVRAVLPNAQTLALTATSGDLDGVGVVVALGAQAAGQAYPGAPKMVAALVMDPALALPSGAVQVSSLPDAFSLLATIRGLSADLRVLAVLAPSGLYDAYVHYLEAAGKVTGVKILLEKADSQSDLVADLRQIKGKAQALWLAPAPLLLEQKNFQFVAEFCRNTRIGLFAPVPELAGAGALAGVAPGALDLGRAAGSAAKDLAAGKAVNKLLSVDQCTVMISAKLAAALGLKVGPRDGQLLP
jgi:hypothetical protein